MALSAGTHLGPYEILSALGVGGMGEVYRARDPKLNRDVAIKVLLPAVANDPERLARFSREAQVLASLNHPNIAHIHGLEDSDGVRALVMELVEGLTLADRIAQGAIPLDDVLPIAKQIAEALEAAHEQGIIHRDLKPANIKVRPDGAVKVLDFGLAKALDPPAGTEAGALLVNSPTITSPAMTQQGVILGTAAYMSPEQAKGRAADKRSDVWAFGCVLYEMLTGRRAFEGEDVSDTMATVLKGEPDWKALPANVPDGVRALIQGCLRKDRKARIADISTARFLLREPDAVTQAAPGSRPMLPPVWRRAMLVVASVLIGAAIAATVVWRLKPLPPTAVTRFALTLPQGHQLNPNRTAVDVSPDGTRIVYAADGRLYLRSMTELEPRALPGTESAIHPVFSPDGQSIAFWANSALKRIAVTGGAAVTISQIGAAPTSMSWSNNGILFARAGGIMRVSPNGGQPEVLVDMSKSDDSLDSPRFLPDGRTLLLTIAKRIAATTDRWDSAQVVVQSIGTGVRKVLIEGGTDGRYVPTGHIVYVSAGTLFARPFDLTSLTVTGEPASVVEGVRRVYAAIGSAHFAFSNTGSLVYLPGASSSQQEFVVFDRNGAVEALKVPPGSYQFPRVSPDGKRLAFESSDGKEAVVSIYELSGDSSVRRLTFGGNNRFPIWSRDGRRVAFQSDREGDPAVFWQPADGGTAERLTTPGRGVSHAPDSWSRDGEVLLFTETKDALSSLWTFSLRDRRAAPFSDVKGSSLPTDAMFSPDGRWVAYQLGERGQGEATTFVQPFPPTGSRYQIARGGRPAWSRDGRELFFVPAPGQFMAVRVRTEPSFAVTSPVAVPRRFGIADPASPRPFDTLPDGRMVGVAPPGMSQSDSGPAQIHVVLNWFEELKARAPRK
ncbi:MAG: serine/threonine-protein kinase [Acidobacteria bacterium]|nr:serine/threonine-protein kinase [Acidobacteriota bacterium]